MARAVVARQSMPALDLAGRRGTFAEISLGFTPEQAVAEAARCIQCKVPQCVTKGCPLHNRIPEWIKLIAEQKFMEAAALTRTTSSMPEICSRVCPQERLCEGSCALGIKQEPVAIGALERFVNDWAAEHGEPAIPTARPTGRTVAIVGAGPAGLSAAEQLRIQGHDVVVYDSFDEPGGLLAHGLPGFKLPRDVVRRRIQLLANAGVNFKGGWRLGERINMEDLFEGLFDAVFVGIGTWTPVVPNLPGRDLPGIVQALDFLRGYEQGIAVRGQTVIVLGGGDTAMDCARTAIRRGAAKAIVAYRRDEANMPGSRKEVTRAREEGVEFHFLSSPLGFIARPDGRVGAVKLQRMELGAPDDEGRRSPIAVPGSDHLLAADHVVLAFGYKLDASWIARELGVELAPPGNVLVNPETGATTRVGVFAGGDCTLGADLVCRAVLAGRRAAAGIHQFLLERDWAALMPAPAVAR